jgi:hypothetical protein
MLFQVRDLDSGLALSTYRITIAMNPNKDWERVYDIWLHKPIYYIYIFIYLFIQYSFIYNLFFLKEK